MANPLGKVGPWLLDVLFPQSCLGCKTIIPSARGFCAECSALLEPNDCDRLDDTPLFAPFHYCGPLTKAIHRLKYEERPEFAQRLVQMAFPLRAKTGFEGAILVPVPVHSVRLVERGYNQASLLAVALAKRWGLRVEHHGLIRRSFVTRQVGLGRKARAENAEGAFVVAQATSLSGKRVVLVDDVVTTGATLGSCRQVLTEAGANVVGIVAVARALVRLPNRANVRAETSGLAVEL